MTYERGNVIAVEIAALGSSVTAPLAIGETVLPVDDVVDFLDSEGGLVLIDGGLYTFIDADDDADTITLATPLATAMEEGDPVELWDPTTQDVSKEWLAQVVLEEGLDGEDPLEAVVPHALTPMLPEGIRDSPAESVSLELDGSEWRVVDILGATPAIDGQAVWNPHSVRRMNTATIPPGSWTAITSWTNIDTDGVSIGADYTITTPALYYVSAQAAFVPNATGRRAVRVILNGDEAQTVAHFAVNADPGGGAITFLVASNDVRLVENDVLTVQVLQTSGANLDLSVAPGRCTASVRRVSI